MSVVSATGVSEAGSVLELGDTCHVREKGKIYEGRIMTHGEYAFIDVMNCLFESMVVQLYF